MIETHFANVEQDVIKLAKLMSKDQEHLRIDKPIKFNGGLIKLTPNGNLTLKQEIKFASISLIKNSKASTTSTRDIVYIKLLLKEQYIA